MPRRGSSVSALSASVQAARRTLGPGSYFHAGPIPLGPVARGGHHVPDRTRATSGGAGGAAGVAADRTWPQTGLREAGYDVRFVGAGGTGFVASNGSGALNYPAALAGGRWVLPCTDPALIGVEGGGNDATRGATDTQIGGGADAVISTLTRTYPTSKIVMIGTLARGSADGGARRTAVDKVLGAHAADHQVAFTSAGDWLTRYGASHQLPDRVHVTQAGHDLLAGVLAHRLITLNLTSTDLMHQH
ncbi:SGNH/GDSL hydrolase family protein [Arthrobacter echini]|uniref:SGNH/GDSL hydrolase family protein n=1 Tax=Arthrobacter echini TaxID=1529066 RepID=UPI0037BE4382